MVPLMEKVAYVSFFAWVAAFITLLIYNGPRSAIVPEWLLSCIGIYCFAELSIIETQPPAEVTRRSTKQVTEPFLTINNSEVNNENGAPVEDEVKRIELREDYYAMTWCGF